MLGNLVSAGLKAALLPVAIAADVVRTGAAVVGLKDFEETQTEKTLDSIQDDIEG
jgi:hypothetical protein